jgi:hypothetical protein
MQARIAGQDANPRSERGHIYSGLASPCPQFTSNLYLNMNLVAFSTTLHASSAWACTCMSPLMGPKRACDADSLPSTRDVCWRPQEAMGLLGAACALDHHPAALAKTRSSPERALRPQKRDFSRPSPPERRKCHGRGSRVHGPRPPGAILF